MLLFWWSLKIGQNRTRPGAWLDQWGIAELCSREGENEDDWEAPNRQLTQNVRTRHYTESHHKGTNKFCDQISVRTGWQGGRSRRTWKKYDSAINFYAINSPALCWGALKVPISAQSQIWKPPEVAGWWIDVFLFHRWPGSTVACHKDRLSNGNQSNGLTQGHQCEMTAWPSKQSAQTHMRPLCRFHTCTSSLRNDLDGKGRE